MGEISGLTSQGGEDVAARLLGLEGFVVTSAGEYGGELELLMETTEVVGGLPAVRGHRRGARTAGARCPRHPREWAAGGAGVEQADLALPGTAV